MENWKFYMIDTASGASVVDREGHVLYCRIFDNYPIVKEFDCPFAAKEAVDRLWAEHRPQENMPRLRPSNWSQLNWEVVVEVIS